MNDIEYIRKLIREELNKFSGDSNPLNLNYIDIWHKGQYAAQSGDYKTAIKLMINATNGAIKNNEIGEANYYKGTVAWLQKDYTTAEKYANDKYVRITGNDSVLKRLLQNKEKSYNDAY
jgi:hypothetical protein